MKTPDFKEKARHVFVSGRSSSGKSTLLLILLGEYINDNKTAIFIFDPEKEFAARLKQDGVDNLARIAEQTAQGKKLFLYCPPEGTDWQTEFDDFCFFCYHYATTFPGRSVMLIDELQDYVDTFNCPETFRNCLQKGRRYSLDMLYASQQANLLHNLIRTQTTEVYSFAQGDALATKFVARLGVDSEHILALHDLEFIHKPIGRAEKKFQIKFDKKGTAAIVPQVGETEKVSDA